MKRILTSVALAASMFTVNQPKPVEPVVKVPVATVSLPADCCGDDCQCCDQCECVGCDKPAKVQEPKPAKPIAKPSRKIGDVQVFDGVAKRLELIVPRSDGGLNYHYRTFNQQHPSPAATSVGINGVRWTYPGTINNHLSSAHGLSQSQLFGKSQAEMESIHNSLHNATRYAPAQPVYRRPAVSQSNCPGGICPQPQRRGWLR